MTGSKLYDVFLSHNSADKDAVEAVARRLEDEAALSPFLDKWHLIPGNPWHEELEQALDAARTCAVFIGPQGIGSWENEEMRSALNDRVTHTGFRVIPVLLPGAILPPQGRLPRFLARLTWVDFRHGLHDPEAFRHLVAGIRGHSPGRSEASAASPQSSVCPYQGLARFDEAQAPFFFGREADTQHLVEHLRTQQFLAVVGPSGSGKSSIIRAGVLPQLRQGTLPGSAGWTYLVCTPGAHPIDALAVALAGVTQQENLTSLRDHLAADEREWYLQTRVLLQTRPASARVCLVVDQFEEVFTLCQDTNERRQFIDALRYAATVADSPSVILLTLRADFLPHAAEYKPLAELLSAHQFLLGPMEQDDLRRACEAPAHRVGLTLEDGLIDIILEDVGREPGLLPLMEDALLQLWERRRGDDVLTVQAYGALGGVRGALAKKADALFTTLSPQQQTIVRRVFLRLTQLGEGTEDTRRRATLGELQTTAGDAEMVAAVVRRLADARLLVTDEDQKVDVAHEALIRGWPQLRGWIEEDRTALRTHRRLTEAAAEWRRLHHDTGMLYRGAVLTVAQEWRERHADDLNVLEQAFLDASVELQHQEEAQERQRVADEQAHLRALADAQRQRAEEQASAAKRLRGVVVVLCCVALAAVGAWLVARNQQQRANIALVKNYWTSAVKAQTEGDGLLAAHFFARVSLLTSDLSEVENTILALHPHLRTFLLGFQLVHEAAISGIMLSKDERFILSWGEDGTVRLWQARDGAALAVMKHEGSSSVHGATFNRDESHILSWEGDGTVRLWQARDGAALAVMKPKVEPQITPGLSLYSIKESSVMVHGATFNRDESRILSWGTDGTVRLWQARDGAVLAVMKHEGSSWVQGATFNRDESHILSWGTDGTVRLWQARDGAALTVMKHERSSWVRGATFNRDESRILSWGDDGTVRLWQARDGAALVVMKHEGSSVKVQGATFNRDESRILSWGDDGTIRLWDMQEDLDFPQDYLRLLVEVATGTAMDDIGNIGALRPEEWTKRQRQYREIAEQHLLTCRHRDANLYLQQKPFWTAQK
jgi:hypothetical protein